MGVHRILKVPEVLLSGDHNKIESFRREQSIMRTKKYRPDLLKKADLSIKEKTVYGVNDLL